MYVLSAAKEVMTGGGLDARTITDALLLGARFGSLDVELATAEFTIWVPSGVAQARATISLNCAEPFTSREVVVQATCPAAPIAGVVQDHPSGAISDWKTVPAGIAS